MPFSLIGTFTKIKTFNNGGTLLPSDLDSALDELGMRVGMNFITGDVKLSARASAPSGWLICNGAEVSRGTYSNLFSAVGTTYGVGNGSSTFNIPDLQGKVPVGVSGSILRGAIGGEATHTLTIPELPSHGHSGSNVDVRGGNGETGIDGGATPIATTNAPATTKNVYVAPAGGDVGHNNMQPYVGLNYMIMI